MSLDFDAKKEDTEVSYFYPNYPNLFSTLLCHHLIFLDIKHSYQTTPII